MFEKVNKLQCDNMIYNGFTVTDCDMYDTTNANRRGKYYLTVVKNVEISPYKSFHFTLSLSNIFFTKHYKQSIPMIIYTKLRIINPYGEDNYHSTINLIVNGSQLEHAVQSDCKINRIDKLKQFFDNVDDTIKKFLDLYGKI